MTEEELIREARKVLSARVQWQQLADALFDAILIVGRDGRVVLANTQALKLLDYMMTEVLGHLVEEFMPEEFRAKHEEYRKRFFLAHDRSPRFMGRGVELFVLTKEGERVQVDIGLSYLRADEGGFAVVTLRPR